MQGSLPAATIDAIVEGRHADPFAVLGVHEAGGAFVVRAFVPGADSLDALSRDGAWLATLARRHDAGFFEGTVPRRTAYRLRAANRSDSWLVDAFAGDRGGLPFTAEVMLPPLGTLWLVHEGEA